MAFAFAIGAEPAYAQTYHVIHNFNGSGDGAAPHSGLTMDAKGNLYGTAYNGGNFGGNCGNYGCGTVFKLTHSSSGWVLTPLYSFAGGDDGAHPDGRVTMGKDGTLYGTASQGAGSGCNGSGCGAVFQLKPSPMAPKSALAPWNETVLYRFTGGGDGQGPQGDLTFDQSGNIFGTTPLGGSAGWGVIYELMPSGEGWTEAVLYSPLTNSNGSDPFGGVTFDGSGNLYGVFNQGGPHGSGAVFALSPLGSNWIEQTLYSFVGGSDGGNPSGGLIIDMAGNLYGGTTSGGGGGGTVFEIASVSKIFKTLYSFAGTGGPAARLVMDAAGDLYGTTRSDGVYGNGSVFELISIGGTWKYASLHDFTGGGDGAEPLSNIVLDANGNLYGTTNGGGLSGAGVVFEITP